MKPVCWCSSARGNWFVGLREMWMEQNTLAGLVWGLISFVPHGVYRILSKVKFLWLVSHKVGSFSIIFHFFHSGFRNGQMHFMSTTWKEGGAYLWTLKEKTKEKKKHQQDPGCVRSLMGFFLCKGQHANCSLCWRYYISEIWVVFFLRQSKYAEKFW